MFVQTVNRMESGWQHPEKVLNGQIDLVTDVSSPGTAYQNASYGMAGLGRLGLGAVLDDITSLNFTALPGDIITGLNPATFDIGAYALVGGLAFLLLGGGLFGGSKKAARQTVRRAKLKGAIAQETELLKSA